MPNTKVQIGQLAPTFCLPADDGQTICLDDLRGKRVILYFYPKDMTPGCTTQACDLRDARAAFEDADYAILGVSPDPVDRHVKFKQKHDLNFPLLADTDNEAALAYGVWREKQNYGKTYMGIVRSTFVIDEQGKIAHILDNTRAKGHADKLKQLLDISSPT